jgi:uncharacterized membrane protein
MKYKLTKFETVLLLIVGVIGAIIGYINTPTIYCITTPCPQPSHFLYSVGGFLLFSFVTYVLFVIYNYILRD